MRVSIAIVLAAMLSAAGASAAQENPRELSPAAINAAEWSGQIEQGAVDPVLLKAQVLLARANFSPGVIDGLVGDNTAKAIAVFQAESGLDPTGRLDDATWAALTQAADEDAVTSYTIAEEDVTGPFVKNIPSQFEEMAELERLAYRSARELLAEKFRMSEDLLRTLNPDADFERAGSEIVVANFPPMDATARPAELASDDGRHARGSEEIRVEVRKGERSVRVHAADGSLIAFFPASIGSEERPAPSGVLKVTRVAYDPTYHYDPELAFKGQPTDRSVEIAPGPNNPVGLVWIELSEDGYGLHGTPEPANVSKTQSHGCIRLTNWDALALAALVQEGTVVEFVDE